MDHEQVKRLLHEVRAGHIDPDQALERLRTLPFEQLGQVARVDHHRELRSGIPEVVLGDSKTAEQITDIMKALAGSGRGALATRVSPAKADAVRKTVPQARYHSSSRILVIEPDQPPAACGRGVIAIISAGTSDLPVAEEAALTAEFLGHRVARFVDVGVAGLHRVLATTEEIRTCEVCIVVAGMEGALPSVVAGLVPCAIVAVPTSVGYGVGAGGFAAMLAMLSSCSPGVTVVNIDNGFGAAVAAARINRQSGQPSD